MFLHPDNDQKSGLSATGHAATLPRPVMNSRRRIRDLPG